MLALTVYVPFQYLLLEVLRRPVESKQYASDDYQQMLVANEADCSMSGVGNCYDNAVAESFFASLKKECLHLTAFATRTEAYDAIEHYIDGFYNPIRRHSAIGYLSPIDYENTMVAAAAA